MTIIGQITTYDENSYQLLHDYLENSYVELTFWGKRSVRSKGYEGSICLDEIARKVAGIFNLHKEITKNEYDLGVKIEEKIFLLEKTRDDLEKNANLVTKVFICMRDKLYFLAHSFDSNPYLDLPCFKGLIMFSDYRS